MKTRIFVLAVVSAVLFASTTNAFGQENPVPDPVQKEQKLMVTIPLKIYEKMAINVEKQEGFILYPQTVITTLSPLLLLGARVTVVSQGQEIPAVTLNLDISSGLMVLMLVRPLSTSIDIKTTNLFSGNDFGENTFILTSQSITNVKDLAKEDTKKDDLRGAVAVDDYGALLGIVSGVEKNDTGTSVPQIIPFDEVGQFIEFLNEGPPIPLMPELPSREKTKVNFDTI